MLGWIKSKITYLYDKDVPAHGLGLFRIFYCLVLFFEVVQIYKYENLIFDYIPFLIRAQNTLAPLLIIWMVVVLFLIFGLFTRVCSIINFLFTLLTFSTFTNFEYHYDFTLVGVNFLFLFIPLNRSFSLDNLLKKLKYSNSSIDFCPKDKVTLLSYYSLLVFGVGLVYFDSVFHKFASYNWLNGLGVWIPASVPSITWNKIQFILDQKWMMYILGYLTLIFEFLFLFIFPIKRLRIVLFLIGVGLHIGIIVFFPIPLFGLGYISIYLLLVPFGFWNKLCKKLKFREPQFILYYKRSSYLINALRTIIQHFDILKAMEYKPSETVEESNPIHNQFQLYGIDVKGKSYSNYAALKKAVQKTILLFPVYLLLSFPGFKWFCKQIYSYLNYFCLNSSFQGPSGFTVFNEKFVEPASPKNSLSRSLHVKLLTIGVFLIAFFEICSLMLSPVAAKIFSFAFNNNQIAEIRVIPKKVIEFSRMITGIYPHGVFLEPHFHGYNHIIEIVYLDKNKKEIWLPIMEKSGLTDKSLSGRLWADWGFRVNGPNIDQKKFELGLVRYTAFWARTNNVSLKNAQFLIKLKKIDIPQKWEKGFLTRQLIKPWVDIGTIAWKNNKAEVDVPLIEGI